MESTSGVMKVTWLRGAQLRGAYISSDQNNLADCMGHQGVNVM